MTEVTKRALADNIKSALTEFPYCVATYIVLAGIAWLILSKYL